MTNQYIMWEDTNYNYRQIICNLWAEDMCHKQIFEEEKPGPPGIKWEEKSRLGKAEAEGSVQYMEKFGSAIGCKLFN